jgi:hypothetical protein
LRNKLKKKKKKQEKHWGQGASSRVLALQVKCPEFYPKCCQKRVKIERKPETLSKQTCAANSKPHYLILGFRVNLKHFKRLNS